MTLDAIESSYEDGNKNLKISSITDESKVEVRYDKADDVSQVSVGEHGCTISRTVGGAVTTATITESGEVIVTHPSGSTFVFQNNGNVNLHAGNTLNLSDSQGVFKRCTCQ